MKKLLVVLLLFITMGCAASNTSSPGSNNASSTDDTGNFMADVCKNIDFSGLQALGEQDPDKMISCDDLAKCASLQGIAPPDIPCK